MIHRHRQAAHLPRNGRQSGQAMVEMIVAAMFFLIPLFLVVVALGKFADIQTTTSEAARYAAWERTVWLTDNDWRNRMGSTANSKSSSEIRSEIAQRIVGVTRPTLRADDKTKNSLSNGSLSLWTDSQNRALLQNYEDLTLTESGKALTAAQCQACLLPTHLPFTAPFDLGIDVPNNDMVVAAAGMNVGMNSASLKLLFPSYTHWAGLKTNDRVALLPNEWMANGRDGVTKIIKEAVPTALQPLNAAVNLAVKPLSLFTTEIIPLSFGQILPDEVPADRVR